MRHPRDDRSRARIQLRREPAHGAPKRDVLRAVSWGRSRARTHDDRTPRVLVALADVLQGGPAARARRVRPRSDAFSPARGDASTTAGWSVHVCSGVSVAGLRGARHGGACDERRASGASDGRAGIDYASADRERAGGPRAGGDGSPGERCPATTTRHATTLAAHSGRLVTVPRRVQPAMGRVRRALRWARKRVHQRLPRALSGVRGRLLLTPGSTGATDASPCVSSRRHPGKRRSRRPILSALSATIAPPKGAQRIGERGAESVKPM